jgi:hypothetical protein
MIRDEVERKKGINWGKRYFDSVTDPGRIDRASLAARPRVQHMLETAVVTNIGPIDATKALSELTEDVCTQFHI